MIDMQGRRKVDCTIVGGAAAPGSRSILQPQRDDPGAARSADARYGAVTCTERNAVLFAS
jgi:hypothetical protein